MPAKIDLTGKRFGHLVVTRPGKGALAGGRKKTTWICDCDCGTKEYEALTARLRNGEVTSCGCMNLYYARKRKLQKDKNIGKKIGIFVVLNKDPDDFTRYICKCNCGRTFTVSQGNLQQTKSCGCQKTGGRNWLDIEGKRYGKLVAIRRIGSSKQKALWEFQCDCGNTIQKPVSYVTSGDTRSCGCMFSEYVANHNEKQFLNHKKRITGKRFGRLRAEKYLRSFFDGYQNRHIYLCTCDCGNETEAISSALLRGQKLSCGCIAFGAESWTYLIANPDRAERDSSIYYVRVREKYDKIGVAENIEKRSNGDFTEIIYERVMPRAAALGVEQVALNWTKTYIPQNLSDEWLNWSGVTELRDFMNQDRTVEMLDALADECEELGWREFWDKYGLSVPDDSKEQA